MNTEKNKIIYLYCVAEKEPDLSEAKKLSKDIYSIQICSFFAVLGLVAEKDFGDSFLHDNIQNLEWLTKFATKHEKIIEAVMLKGANVIPFKFATLFYNQNNLESSLTQQKMSLTENFRKLIDKEEWGLKVFCNTDCLLKEITKTNKKLEQFDNEINNSKPGKAYILNKKRQELLKEILNQEINNKKIYYFNKLKDLSVENKVNKNQPKELSGKKEEMILNAVFLVPKSKITEFIDQILNYKAKNGSFIFEYSGPWPPYNFVSFTEVETG